MGEVVTALSGLQRNVLLVSAAILLALGIILLWRFKLMLFPAIGRETSIEDAQASAPASKHLLGFLWGAAGITCLVAALTIAAGTVYGPVSEQWPPDARFSAEAYVGVLALVFSIPIAFAGSIYAIYVAILGLRGSQQQVRLAEQANTYGDPAYDLSQRAYSAYRRYGFLVGSLLASYRLFKHQSELAVYRGAPTQELASPAWNEICEQLRQLLFNEAFAVASMEAARLLDRKDGSIEAQTNQHNLRRAFASMIAALAPLDGCALEPMQVSALRTLGSAMLLNAEIEAGLAAVAGGTGEEGDLDGVDRQLLRYLGQWMGDIDRVETGRELLVVSRANAFAGEEFQAGLGKPPEPAEVVLRRKMESLFAPLSEGATLSTPGKCGRLGTHDHFMVAALLGDHSTISELSQAAARMATEYGWEPIEVMLKTAGDWQRLAAGPVRATEESKIFHIVIATPGGLEHLFSPNGIGKGFHGCVLIDGLVNPGLSWIENGVAERDARIAKENKSVDAARDNQAKHTEDLHGLRSDRDRIKEAIQLAQRLASSNDPNADRIHLEELHVSLKEVEERIVDLEANAPTEPGRRAKMPNPFESAIAVMHDRAGRDIDATDAVVLWVGMDYRELGVAPPVREGDASGYEMSAIMARGDRAVSREVQCLTGLGG